MAKPRNSKGQFTKGKSGNPKGRPKNRVSIPDILRLIGEEPAAAKSDKTKLEVVMRRVYQFAHEGKPWAVQFIADRTEGKAVERVQIGNAGDLATLSDAELEAIAAGG